jgi:transposase
MKQYSKYVGMDVHKETIMVAVAATGNGEARYYGEIQNTPDAIAKMIKKVAGKGEVVAFCYEAGPCGYGLYRQIRDLKYQCDVVAPSLIPRKTGDRVKTDRRDSISLARLYRAGELTSVWVPDKVQEGMRDLTRAREDMKEIERHCRQRLGAFLLRNGKRYSGKSKWTQAHFRWLEEIKFDFTFQQIVFQEYVDMVKNAQLRVADMEEQMRQAINEWAMKPVVEGLMALRGVSFITAMTIVAEIGDLSRFDNPRQLMAHLGLVPSEYSSGGRCKRGSITKTGNGHARRVLVEAAWCYRLPARKSAKIQRRAEKTSEAVQAIAWKAQKRLCSRFWHHINRGKLAVQSCTAIARELSGFIWAIACEVMKEKKITVLAKG